MTRLKYVDSTAGDVHLLAMKMDTAPGQTPYEPTAEEVELAQTFAAEVYKRWMNRNTRNAPRSG